jgi:ABC-type phosphate transport system substrate-binding protein
MRLFEIAPPRTDGPEPVLMAILSYLKGKGDQRATGVRVPMSSIEALMQNAGQSISYAELENLRQKNQTIANLIKSINQDEVIINTNNNDEVSDNPEYQPGDEQDVAMMAKRAATRND